MGTRYTIYLSKNKGKDFVGKIEKAKMIPRQSDIIVYKDAIYEVSKVSIDYDANMIILYLNTNPKL